MIYLGLVLFGWPDDNSLESKHVPVNIIFCNKLCFTETCILYEVITTSFVESKTSYFLPDRNNQNANIISFNIFNNVNKINLNTSYPGGCAV